MKKVILIPPFICHPRFKERGRMKYILQYKSTKINLLIKVDGEEVFILATGLICTKEKDQVDKLILEGIKNTQCRKARQKWQWMQKILNQYKTPF